MSRRKRKIAFSKELRQRSTRTEEIAWNILRAKRCMGLKFRRQYGISGFIIDFYCFELRLAVEIDGSSHEGRELYDAERQRIIESEGIEFIRITNEELIQSPKILIDRIRTFASNRMDLSLSNLLGEGQGVRTEPTSERAAPLFSTFPLTKQR